MENKQKLFGGMAFYQCTKCKTVQVLEAQNEAVSTNA